MFLTDIPRAWVWENMNKRRSKMIRDFWTNKWVLGGVGFLILLSIACYFWYQHDIADEKKAAAEAEEIALQWEDGRHIDAESKTVEMTDPVLEMDTESETTEITTVPLKIDILETDMGPLKRNADGAYVVPGNMTLYEYYEKLVNSKVWFSPHGFGPYPKVPEEFMMTKSPTSWQQHQLFGIRQPSRNSELSGRVVLKLWKDGDTEVQGGVFENGKVYVLYPNRVYVRYNTMTYEDGTIQTNPDGTPVKYISSWLSTPDNPPLSLEQVIGGYTPEGVELIDLDVEDPGIEPYSFLGLN